MTQINVKEIEELSARLHSVPDLSSLDDRAVCALDALLAFYKESVEREPVEFLLGGNRLKLSFRQEECESCGQTSSHLRTVPIDQYSDELEGRWVALVPAENDRHIGYQPPASAARIAELESKLEGLRTQVGIFNGRFEKDQGRIVELEQYLTDKHNECVSFYNEAEVHLKTIAKQAEKLRIAREALVWLKAGFNHAANGHISHKAFSEYHEIADKALAALGEE